MKTNYWKQTISIGGICTMKRVLLTLTILILMAFVVQAQADVPHLINYQGMLTDAAGDPLATKEYKLTFNIFQQSTGGTAVWGPQVFEQVPVVRGHFNVILGPTDSHNRNIVAAFTSANTYLEITVGNGAPITPRQQILSTPYALNGVPPGTIAAYWGYAPPPGWLLCHGQLIPAGSEYDSLRNIVGPNVPDLRGLFLRGRNEGRADGWGDPSERPLGWLQEDATRIPHQPFTTDVKGNHNHGDVLYHYTATHNGGTGQRDIHWNVRYTTGPYAGNHSHLITGGGDSETRPKNICVNWIIKY
jgi:hypothetical protein